MARPTIDEEKKVKGYNVYLNKADHALVIKHYGSPDKAMKLLLRIAKKKEGVPLPAEQS